MAKHLGPIEILCDAPPYSIIQACNRIGVQRPEDVRWCRMSRFAQDQVPGQVIAGHAWKSLLGMSAGKKGACGCGQDLPLLEKCTFTFITGRQASYYIGQCKRCHRVYWDEA